MCSARNSEVVLGEGLDLFMIFKKLLKRTEEFLSSHINFKSPPPAKAREVNYDFFDRFTIAHFLIGAFYGVIHLNFQISLIMAMAWELIENPLKVNLTKYFPHATADTWKNSIGDVLTVMGGWLLVIYALGGNRFF